MPFTPPPNAMHLRGSLKTRESLGSIPNSPTTKLLIPSLITSSDSKSRKTTRAVKFVEDSQEEDNSKE